MSVPNSCCYIVYGAVPSFASKAAAVAWLYLNYRVLYQAVTCLYLKSMVLYQAAWLYLKYRVLYQAATWVY